MPDVLGTGTALGAGRTFAGGSLRLGWSTKTANSVPRYGMSAEQIDGLVYTCGGWSSSPQPYLMTYNATSNTWAFLVGMPGSRWMGQMAAVGGKLYYFGGMTTGSGGYQNNCWEYDPVAATWTTKTTMPRSRASGGAAVVGGLIYLLGGKESSSTYSSAVDVYNPTTDTWTTKTATLPTPREYVDCADGGNGYIYIAGGFTGSSQSVHHRYDPVADSFSTMAALPAVRYGHTMNRLGSLIYVTGGFTTEYSASHIAYDPSTNTWSTKASMGTGRYLLAGTPVPAGIYAIGGNNGGVLGTNEFFRAPELEGSGLATGRGVLISQPIGNGAALGTGVANAEGDVFFSGRTMQPGPIRLDERP